MFKATEFAVSSVVPDLRGGGKFGVHGFSENHRRAQISNF